MDWWDRAFFRINSSIENRLCMVNSWELFCSHSTQQPNSESCSLLPFWEAGYICLVYTKYYLPVGWLQKNNWTKLKWLDDIQIQGTPLHLPSHFFTLVHLCINPEAPGRRPHMRHRNLITQLLGFREPRANLKKIKGFCQISLFSWVPLHITFYTAIPCA